MFKKLTIVLSFYYIFLNSIYVNAKNFRYIEIFDPKQDKVVKVVQLDEQVESMVIKWIKNIDGIYGKNDPATDDGYVVKIPLTNAVKVQSKTINAVISEVYILIPEKNPPFYMIFVDVNKLECFPFNGDVDALSKSLDFKLKSQ